MVKRGTLKTFLNGVAEFVSFAHGKRNSSNGKIICRCTTCKNLNFLDSEDVKVHLCRKGFILGYWYWTCHRKIDPTLSYVHHTYSNLSTHVHESHNQDFDRMIHEAVGVEFSVNYDEQNEDFPNTEAKNVL